MSDAAQKLPWMLDLVNRDLRGQLLPNELTALQDNPAVWLNLLYGIVQSLNEQLRTRERAIEFDLYSTDRGSDFTERLRKHSAWKRRTEHLHGVALRRVAFVRAMIPDGDLRVLLLEACELVPDDIDSVRAWQARVREFLAV